MTTTNPIDTARNTTGRNTAEQAVNAAKARINTTLFKEHLDEAQANTGRAAHATAPVDEMRKPTPHQQNANAEIAIEKANTAKKSASSKRLSHGRQRASDKSTAPDQSSDAANQTAAAATITGTALPLIGIDLQPATASAPESGNADASPSLAAKGGETANPGTDMPADPGSTPEAAAESTGAGLQTAPSDTGAAADNPAGTPATTKDFTLVRTVEAGPSHAGASTTPGDSEAHPLQTGTSGNQPIKVVVQPKTVDVAPPSTGSSAILAQQNAATAEQVSQPGPNGTSGGSGGADTDSGDPGEAMPVQSTVTQANLSPAAADANQPPQTEGTSAATPAGAKAPDGLATVIAGLSGSGQSNHKHEFGSDSADGGTLPQSDSGAAASAEPATSASANSTSFASLVTATNTVAAVSAKPVTIASETAAQVPPPPIEQMVFGISRLNNGANSFSMQLAPERLGSVSVQLEVDAKGKTRATFSAERPETLALMRQDSHQLVKALQDAGVKADAGSLSFSLKDQGSAANQERRASSGSTSPQRMAVSATVSSAPGPATDAPPATISSRLYDLQA